MGEPPSDLGGDQVTVQEVGVMSDGTGVPGCPGASVVDTENGGKKKEE